MSTKKDNKDEENKLTTGELGQIQKNTKAAIITHDMPDADAMASAIGIQYILKKKYNVNSDIFYGGEISHPENKAMVNVLSLSLKHIHDLYIDDTDKYNLIIIVDATENNVKLQNGYKANIIIDHHRAKIKEDDYQFVLNKQAGSCSTLVYSLIEKEGLEFGKSDSDKTIATALLFGLIKDSNNLLSDDCIQDDFDIYRKLSTISDLSKIKEIQNYPLPNYFFEMAAKAIDEDSVIESNGTFATFLGHLPEAKRDVLPYLSDMFMRKSGITTTIVTAIVGNKIDASVRSKSVSLDVNSFCQKVFGKEYAGGKKGSGGAQIPLGIFAISDSDDDKDKVIELVKNRVLSNIKKEISSES